MSRERIEKLAALHRQTELVYIEKRKDGRDWKRAWRARDRWMKRWERWGSAQLAGLHDVPVVIGVAKQAYEAQNRGVEKDVSALFRRIRAWLTDAAPNDWQQGAVTSYIGLSLDTSNEAGNFALEALGINEDFAWAHPRAMGRDMFAVRGSKVIQNLYGNHMDKLTEIILRATNPARPLTVEQAQKEISTNWPNLMRWQARRIARTETAAVWETTNLNVMRANGVTQFDWFIATGPSIGTTTEEVCSTCLAKAARNPYTASKLEASGGMPPAHPNCRCTLLPVLRTPDGGFWLPPKEPWTGEEIDNLIPTPEVK